MVESDCTTVFRQFVHIERINQMFEQKLNSTRSIARKLAREIRPDEMAAIAAGTDSCCGGSADD